MKESSPYKYLPAEFAESLRSVGIAVRRPARGAREGLHRSPHYGSSVEFAEYREYSPGDSVDLIDWAVYARSDKYMIRRFHEETNLRAYILLDTSDSLSFRDEGAMTKMEYARFLAAGLMYVLANQGDSVGLMTFGGRIIDSFEPVGTWEGLRPLLLALEGIEHSGRGDIEASIHQAAEMVRPGSLIILISDLLQDVAQIVRGVMRLYHDGHNIMALHVLDRGEINLSFGGVAELKELETGARLVVEVDQIRDAYRSAVERYLHQVRAACVECMAEYHLMDTRTPIDEAFNVLRTQGKVV